MNTPPKKRRYQWAMPEGPHGEGPFVHVIRNPDYAVAFAEVLTAFESLEAVMPRVLAVLSGQHDDTTAGYIYRSVRNPSIRLAMLRDLLEKSPYNANKTDLYDSILAEYGALRTIRNDYTHGHWFTSTADSKVYLAKSEEHGLAFFDAHEEPLDNLRNAAERIHRLIYRIMVDITPDMIALRPQTARPPQSEAPKPK